MLDSAIIRRLTARIHVDLPTIEERHEFFRSTLSKRPNTLDQSQIGQLASATSNYSYSDLRQLAQQGAMESVRELTLEQLERLDFTIND